MGFQGRLQVKPEKRSGAGPVPVKVDDEWTDAGRVRVFLFSDGTKTRVPWRYAANEHGGTTISAPTFDEALERKRFVSELEACRNEALAPLWLKGARQIVGGMFVLGLGVAALGVRSLVAGVDLASDLVEWVLR